jgi:hypothetical protein
MQKVIEISSLLVAHGPEIVSAVVAILSGIIAISLLIPGEQPEKTLKAVVAFLSKFSRKSEKEEG